MTLLGLLAFFGLAVVTMDVLGGVLAATMLGRGVRPAHLLYFLGGYAAVVTAATIVLKPLLVLAGEVLAPVIGSRTWLIVIEMAVGCALLAFAALQRHNALHPKPPVVAHEVRDRIPSLIGGGMLFSATVLADPTYPVAIGLAMQVQPFPLELLLLIAWNLVYQAPIVAVTIAALFGAHERVLSAAAHFFGPRRRGLLMLFAGVLAIAGLVVIGDGIFASASSHRPWLQSLLLLGEHH